MDRAADLGQEGGMRRSPLLGNGPLVGGIAVVVVLAVAFGTITVIALEGREVVVLRTRTADGSQRTTRTWIAEADGAVWIEAANPARPFLHDLARSPELVLDRHGRPWRCRATVAPNPEGHTRIREMLAAKYGWADCWIALVADTRRSLAVRLDCDDATDEGPTERVARTARAAARAG